MSKNEGWEEPPSKKTKLHEVPLETEDQHLKISKDKDTQSQEEDFASDLKYDNFVTPEELGKLKEFTVLDEVKSNDEDSNEDESDSSDGKSEGLPEDEIDKMLEEDLPEGFKGTPQPKAKPYVIRQKIVLEEKGVNHWESLPLDWMMVRHYSGMPVYMHRTTRVCTLSKPYFLGRGNTRRHDIPISAIPCLAYRKALEEEKKQMEIDKKIEEQIRNGTWTQNLVQQNQSNAQTNNEKKVTNISNTTESKCPYNGNKCKETEAVDQICSGADPTDRTAVDSAKESHENDEQISKNNNANIESITTEMSKNNDAGIESIATETSKNNDAKIESIETEINKNNDHDDNMESIANELEEGEINTNVDNETENDANGTEVANVKEPQSKTDSETNTNAEEGAGKDKSEEVEIPRLRQPVILAGGVVVPAPKVENINTSWKTQQLSHEQLNDYCQKLFHFKTVNIMHFNQWEDRRKYTKYTKARKTLQYPTLPDGTKLITIPAPNGQTAGGKPVKRDWVMNMDGRSYLSVFHEYVCRALQKHPVYEFVQLENAATPYQATVYIGGMQYGVGHGSSKRQAKSAAARASIHILIPEMKDDLDKPPTKEPDFSFFDQVGIEDPRISEFCAATCEPSPHAILRTCLLRNFGASDRHIQTEMKKLELQKIELTMKVGKHSATVVCKNKKTAKQRASQAILQALHPHVRSWGSLLRLYGSRSVKSCKQRKLEEQQITLLQDQARHNQPNRAVLAKLRAEMDKLRARDRAVVPIGTLLLEDALPTHSGSNLNNVDL